MSEEVGMFGDIAEAVLGLGNVGGGKDRPHHKVAAGF